MNSFEREVLDRLARIEAAASIIPDIDKRVSSLERVQTRAIGGACALLALFGFVQKAT